MVSDRGSRDDELYRAFDRQQYLAVGKAERVVRRTLRARCIQQLSRKAKAGVTMSQPLFRHPFPVEAYFKHSLVLAYAVSADRLRERLPPYLEVDTFEDRVGFVAAAFVDTRALRPKGFPAILGRDFILAGYRIFVRYRDARGRRLRGLYILRSETNKTQMCVLGNFFTSYKYHHVPITFAATPEALTISAPHGLDVSASIATPVQEIALPHGSPFSSWKEARRYSGPLPFTFSYHARRSEMVIVEGVREGWQPRPVEIVRAHVPTIEVLGFRDCQLANAFLVSDIPYFWKAGVVERLPHERDVVDGAIDEE